MNLKSLTNRILKRTLGLRIQKASEDEKPKSFMNVQNLLFEADTFFNEAYDTGIKITGTPFDDDSKYFTKRRIRFYNTMQLFMSVHHLPGDIIECGCFKGLSSYLMCRYIRRVNSAYRGEGFTLVDSFEGLSEPSSKDSLSSDSSGNMKFFTTAGHFATPLEEVKAVFTDFPEMSFVKGWIPEALPTLPEKKFKFVHIDLDWYDPIKGALAYFYPRLAPGGIIVVDDYGSLFWPGAKKAVDEFCVENNLRFMNISTAQAIISKQ